MFRFGFKKSFMLCTLVVAALFSACTDPAVKKANAEYKELVEKGKMCDAMIVKIDSVTNECTYSFKIKDKAYTGHCKQIDKTPLSVEDIILVVYLERDPFISRRFSTESK